MKKYIVHKVDTVEYSYEVKANSALEAEEKILMGDFDGTTHYLGDSWGSGTQCDATEITETRNK